MWLTGRWNINNVLIKPGHFADCKHEGENDIAIKELAYSYKFAANVNIQTFAGKFISVSKLYRFPFNVVTLQKQLGGHWVTRSTVISFTGAIKAKVKQLQINSKRAFLYPRVERGPILYNRKWEKLFLIGTHRVDSCKPIKSQLSLFKAIKDFRQSHMGEMKLPRKIFSVNLLRNPW